MNLLQKAFPLFEKKNQRCKSSLLPVHGDVIIAQKKRVQRKTQICLRPVKRSDNCFLGKSLRVHSSPFPAIKYILRTGKNYPINIELSIRNLHSHLLGTRSKTATQGCFIVSYPWGSHKRERQNNLRVVFSNAALGEDGDVRFPDRLYLVKGSSEGTLKRAHSKENLEANNFISDTGTFIILNDIFSL